MGHPSSAGMNMVTPVCPTLTLRPCKGDGCKGALKDSHVCGKHHKALDR